MCGHVATLKLKLFLLNLFDNSLHTKLHSTSTETTRRISILKQLKFRCNLTNVIFSPENYFQIWFNYIANEVRSLFCKHISFFILMRDFDAGPMNQKCIVQNLKFIIQVAHDSTLYEKWFNQNETLTQTKL